MNKESYKRYLKTPHWRRIKQRFYETFEYRCCLLHCQERHNLELHHTTYERVGKERMIDLVYVCRKHHQALTDGVIELGKVTYSYPKNPKIVRF